MVAPLKILLVSKIVRSLCLLGSFVCCSQGPRCLAEENIPRLILIGDSTVKCGRANGVDGLWGWGQAILPHFNLERITIENHAIGGRSSRTFFTEGRWEEASERLRPGDFLLIQFGHNDGGKMFEGDRPRASIKGNGDEVIEGVVEVTRKQEVVRSYGWYLRKFVNEAKNKGALPMVLSLVPRNRWQDDQVIRADKDYAKWAEEAAKQSGALFIDLNDLVASRYEQLGKDAVAERLFTANDWTHTTLAGAKVNAEAVVVGIRSLTDCPLASYLKPDMNSAIMTTGGIQYAFGGSESSENMKLVEAEDKYCATRGFGFEPGAKLEDGESPSNTGCNSSEPFYFSVTLPEGNYRVNVLSGRYSADGKGRASTADVLAKRHNPILAKHSGIHGKRSYYENQRSSFRAIEAKRRGERALGLG